jgi:deoxyribonuclease V
VNLRPPLHPWNLTPREAVALQRELAGRVELTWDGRAVERVAGVDVAVDRDEQRLFAGVVVLSHPALAVVEEVGVEAPVTFPYVPGLLTFREVPALLACFARLEAVPDLVVCDGQGTAHPRRMGLACHLGLWLDMPTIGCAKSRLTGSHREPGQRRGCATRLYDADGEEIGRCLRTRDGVRPVYCSPGHLIDGVTAMRWVLRLCRRYRLPETTRAAHHFVTRLRRGDARPTATLE